MSKDLRNLRELVLGKTPSESARTLMAALSLAGCAFLWRDNLRLRREGQTLKESEHILEHQALHDPLTDLPNRAMFMDSLNRALSHGRRHGHPVGILFLDLNGFKQVNDMYGHETGDQVLRVAAERLRLSVRPEDMVSRYGGDEFAILLSDITSEEQLAEISQRLVRRLSAPIRLHDRDVALSASIGYALGSPTEVSAEELVRRADLHMYREKVQDREHNLENGFWAVGD